MTETELKAALQWIASGDVGASSKTIWCVMMGVVPDSPAYPHDPADFGRCYRLLKRLPSWRSRLHEMAEKYPRTWSKLVTSWDEIERLYLEELPSGNAPKCFALLESVNRS